MAAVRMRNVTSALRRSGRPGRVVFLLTLITLYCFINGRILQSHRGWKGSQDIESSPPAKAGHVLMAAEPVLWAFICL